jgi:hypothetical protein
LRAKQMCEWQVCFEIKGLIAPEKPLKFDAIAFKKAPTSNDEIPSENNDRSIVFLKVTSDKRKDFMAMRKKLQEFLSLYGLVTGDYVECPFSYVSYPINESTPFGEINYLSKVFGGRNLTDEQKEKHYRLLNYSVQTFKDFGSVFADSSKRYLKNAITYYYRALKDLSYMSTEEALIDEMISLEALLGLTGYGLSLRASILLSLDGKEKAYDIQKKINSLCKKRNKIVHGSEAVSVTIEEIFELKNYVNKLIFIFLKVNKPREYLISIVDKSVLEWDFRTKLIQLTQKLSQQGNNVDKKET